MHGRQIALAAALVLNIVASHAAAEEATGTDQEGIDRQSSGAAGDPGTRPDGQERGLADTDTEIDVFVITGSAEGAARAGGSAYFLDAEELQENNYADINRILRAVPGVNIQEEDGFGLRPNIGLRGTGLDRSSRIALIEDGVPIAPAPYAAPSAYYFPRAGRMSAIEVTKGPAAIVYGPLTTGGAIHMFSTPVPDDFAAYVDLMAGEDDRFQGHAYIGATEEVAPGFRAGFVLETFQDQSDGFKELDGRNTGFDIDDYVGRFRFEFDDLFGVAQSFELKLQSSEELSNETYLGLTQEDFDRTPFLRYAGSQLDEMNNEHGIGQITHTVDFSNNLRLLTTAYRTEFQRNWFKLNKVVDPIEGATSISAILDDPDMFAGAMEILRGADGFVSADDALRVKANNRSYWAQGIQSTLQFDFDGPYAAHSIDVSLRYHEDEMDRFQWVDRFRMDNGTMVRTTVGIPGTDSNRIDSAEAWAGFIRDEISFGDWTVTPGLRYESIDISRHDFGKADPDRTGASLRIIENSVDVFIPGLSVTYDVNDRLMLLAGVHRGFTPPAPGSGTEPEDSTNWEAGLRWFGDIGRAELIGFYSDYENLLGTCTNSTGGNCTIGDQFDGGEVGVLGLEATYGAEFETPWAGVVAPVSIAYTWTRAEFENSFESDFDPWGSVTAGDELPYIPEHQLTISAGVTLDSWRATLTANYVSEARSQAGHGAIPSSELVDERWVSDLSLGWNITPAAEVYARVDNIFDETYVTARRPAGLRPGLPRTAMVGVRIALTDIADIF